MQNAPNAFEDLFSKTTDYLETRTEMLKLKATGKVSEMASSVVAMIVIAGVSCMVIIFLNISIAIWLGSILNQLYLGFLAVAGFYLLLLLILYLGRKQFLKAPVRNSIIKQMLN